MKRKPLKGLANALCQMFAGDRRYDDDAALAQLGGGRLRLNLLTGTASLDERTLDGFGLVDQLAQWLRTSLDTAGIAGIAPDDIIAAVVDVAYTVSDHAHTAGGSRILTMHFTPRSEIVTDDLRPCHRSGSGDVYI